jgi:hypothetical protein
MANSLLLLLLPTLLLYTKLRIPHDEEPLSYY